ncbi:unnamed protein product [Adineta ricciae]|uniref:Uncharacterized protein n=1 Tax=Adineta ricciae TaxID=249248 RepID=A0A815RU24_ADIRI|nr:unnamed protein product [Adineta ricciae]CAF1536863.1 unnamed protein product [Adineta ricciae]
MASINNSASGSDNINQCNTNNASEPMDISNTMASSIRKEQLANRLPIITPTPSVPSPRTPRAIPRDPDPKRRCLEVTFKLSDSGLSNSLPNISLLSKCVKNMSIENESDQK